MSPPNPEDDPIHKGLHDLGRQIEEAEGANPGPEAAGEDPEPGLARRGEPPTPPAASAADVGADDELPWPSPPPAETSARTRAAVDTPQGGGEAVAAPAAPGAEADPADNPVERGLHELGRQIDEAERDGRSGTAGGGRGGRGDGGPAHAAPKKKRSTRRKVTYVLGSIFLVLVLIAGAAAGYAWYLNDQIHRIDLHNLSDSPSKGADAGRRTS